VGVGLAEKLRKKKSTSPACQEGVALNLGEERTTAEKSPHSPAIGENQMASKKLRPDEGRAIACSNHSGHQSERLEKKGGGGTLPSLRGKEKGKEAKHREICLSSKQRRCSYVEKRNVGQERILASYRKKGGKGEEERRGGTGWLKKRKTPDASCLSEVSKRFYCREKGCLLTEKKEAVP